jgi:hypothetical protein
MQSFRFALLVASVVMLTAAGGCGPSKPARVVPPSLDVAGVVAGVMEQADANGNGRIEAAELATVPALVSAVSILDTDGDKAISAAELETWLTAVKNSKVAITSLALRVTQKGKPLSGVTVRLVPEPFMGPEAKPAEGTTDATGQAALTIAGSPYPGVNCGLYRVAITGQGAGGKPIPASSNTATTLGAAVGGMLPPGGMLVFNLD